MSQVVYRGEWPEDVKESFRLLASGEVKAKPLISGSIPLEGVEDGLKRMMEGDCLKLAVHPGEEG